MNTECNGGFDCTANQGDCKEEPNYCGVCEAWCHQCILDFGAASCTPLTQCLAECAASPDCNRDREVCEDCKDGCMPEYKDPCDYSKGEADSCNAPCEFTAGIGRYDREWLWQEMDQREIELVAENNCSAYAPDHGTCTAVNTTSNAASPLDSQHCRLNATLSVCDATNPADVDIECHYVPPVTCGPGSGCRTFLEVALTPFDHRLYDVDFLEDVVGRFQNWAQAKTQLAEWCPTEYAACFGLAACSREFDSQTVSLPVLFF